MSKVEQYITSIPDFPKEGIIFRDITTVLGDADGFHLAVDEMTALLDGVEFDAIAGLESRGFLFGAPMAYNLHKAFIPIRKQGKLPRATSRMSYELEYGMETIEVHRDDIKPGMKIVVVDDLIATGGTLEAALSGWFDVLKHGGVLAMSFNTHVTRREGLVRLFEKAGFEIVQTANLEHWVEQAISRDVILARKP